MLDILFSNADFLVVNKPQGVSVHKDQEERGLTMQLESQLGQKLFLVHRLDKVTSGLMVFAKHAEAASKLAEQFSLKRVKKYYLALSDRKPRRKQGLISGDMKKARRSSWKLTKSMLNPAITQFFSSSAKPGLRVFLIKPCTGKTHQIRVALKSEGAAILGDELYNGSDADRTYLHAYALGFEYDDKPYQFKQIPNEGELFDSVCLQTISEKFSEPDSLIWPVIKMKG